MHKPTLLGYSSYMAECSRRLVADHEFDGDEIVLALIGSKEIDQDVYERLYCDRLGNTIDNESVLSNIQLLEMQLNSWRDSFQFFDSKLSMCHP